jgi:hypothetical protein
MTRLARYSPARVIGATLGLSVTGAVLGGVAGAVALGIGLLFKAGLETFSHLSVLLIPGAIGAALGSVCAPLAGWLLLRRVPLGRAFAGLVVGTVLGGLAGWFFPVTFNILLQPIATAAAGFVAAALVMRRRYRGDHLHPREPPVGAN